MSLDKFCWMLFAITFGGQTLALVLWLAKRELPRITARLPRWTPWFFLMVGGLTGPLWAVAAFEVGTFPVAHVRRMVGNDRELAQMLMFAISQPGLPWMWFLNVLQRIKSGGE